MPNESSSHTTETRPSPAFVVRHPYLWAATPACALFGLSFALSGSPLPVPLVNQAEAPEIAEGAGAEHVVLPASETLVVARQSAAGSVLLQGRMQPPVGSTVVAPSSGQVARVLVRPGQTVQANQEIAVISTGVVASSRNFTPIERGQTRAERAQIAAVQRQRAWQQRVRAARERLEKAQARVQQAQLRVASARDVVRRLQSGEEVSTAEVQTPASTPEPRETTRQARSSSKNVALREAALRDSQKLQEQADDAESRAAAKKRAASQAEATAKSKNKQWLAAQEVADNITISSAPSTPAGDEGADKNGDAKATPKPTADNGSAARKRAAQDRANALKADADVAQDQAASLRREADRLEARAEGLRKKANDSARQAAALLQNLRVFDNEGESGQGSGARSESTPRVAKSNGGGGKISVSEAVRMARSAMEESRAAIADADRIRRQVESYERPVENTREAFDDATRRLSAAQERMWDAASAATPNMRPVIAGGSGVVLWIAELTREVRAGDPLAAIGRADRMEVVLQDKSGAWKSVRPGSQILALVQPGAAPRPGTPASGAVVRPTAAINPVRQVTRGIPTLARVIGVRPPQGPQAPAVLRVAIHNPRRNTIAPNADGNTPVEGGGIGRTFAPGTPVLCSLSQPGQRTEIAIPSDAIRRDANGERYVAVLAPVADTAVDINADLCRIEWRKVRVGRGDGFQNLILSGLEIGDRIALRPQAMQNFTLIHGPQATLRVEQA